MKFLRSFTSVTRWLLVVFGCAVLATAQPMSSEKEPSKPAVEDAIIYPKNSPDRSASSPLTRESSSGRTLIVVVAFLLAVAGAWVLIQRRQSGLLASRGLRKLQLEETRALGNRQYLVVASYEGKKFLLGVTPGQIQLLTALAASGGEETKS